jgi:hypothetical protein
MISLRIPALILASIMLGGVVGISATNTNAQPFDITSEQGDQQALITVKLATNNTVVIPPNGTIIEVPGNVTVIDNSTVVVAPDNSTVTPLPGNVTVITPPEPQPCACPPIEEQPTPGIPPVIVTPAPGQNVTTELPVIVVENVTEPIPFPEPVQNETASNNTEPTAPIAPGDNVTGIDPGSNDTGLAPASLIQQLAWWQSST